MTLSLQIMLRALKLFMTGDSSLSALEMRKEGSEKERKKERKNAEQSKRSNNSEEELIWNIVLQSYADFFCGV